LAVELALVLNVPFLVFLVEVALFEKLRNIMVLKENLGNL
jgi:hypothetical protein